MFLCLTLGGLIQGFALYDPGVDFMSSVSLGGAVSSDECGGCACAVCRYGCLRRAFCAQSAWRHISCRRRRASLQPPRRSPAYEQIAHTRLWDLPGLHRRVVRYCRLFLSPARSHGAGRRRKHRAMSIHRRFLGWPSPGSASMRQMVASPAIRSKSARERFRPMWKRNLDRARRSRETTCVRIRHSWEVCGLGLISPTSV